MNYKNKLKFIVAILIIVSALAYLVYGGVRDTMVYYLTVTELKERVPEVYKDRVRITGTVVPGTIQKEIDGKLSFKLTDGDEILDIRYKGIIPDIFRDEVEAVVEGKYSSDNIFKADILLAKCPTKYESEDQLYPKEPS